ncbi:MAG: hypothetical protein AAB426_07840 [Myxococcota bacterium]
MTRFFPLPADAVRRVAEHLPFPPHDFVRGLSLDADRTIYASSILASIPDELSLRFACELPDRSLAAVVAQVLPWDTEFFGVKTARLHGAFGLDAPLPSDADLDPAVTELCTRAKQLGVRYLFGQLDARDLAATRALGNAGFALIETRLFYHRDITDFSWPERYETRGATAEDVPSLAETARVMVNQYDRFHADPFFDPTRVDALMRVWVENSITKGFADFTICPAQLAPTGFCTAKYHRAHWQPWGKKLAQPVLSAVSPDMKGWYRKIISELTYHLRDEGAEHAFMITQAANKAVIHVWESLGYRFGRCENVFRRIL